MHKEKTCWNFLGQKFLLWNEVGQGQEGYSDDCLFFAMIIAPKVKCCLKIIEEGKRKLKPDIQMFSRCLEIVEP